MKTKIIIRDIKSYLSCLLHLPLLYSKLSFSQEGEDLIIERYFRDKEHGFFIDIGAFHPYKYSNTYKLYKKGWKGINIDANKNNIKLFNLARKRDRNIFAGVGNKKGYGNFYTFEDPALNTFDKNIKESIVRSKQSVFLKKHRVRMLNINNILKKYGKIKYIDLLNIDAEGESYNIIKSFNFNETHPNIVAIERENMGREISVDRIINYMKRNRYKLIASTPMTYFFEYSK